MVVYFDEVDGTLTCFGKKSLYQKCVRFQLLECSNGNMDNIPLMDQHTSLQRHLVPKIFDVLVFHELKYCYLDGQVVCSYSQRCLVFERI